MSSRFALPSLRLLTAATLATLAAPACTARDAITGPDASATAAIGADSLLVTPGDTSVPAGILVRLKVADRTKSGLSVSGSTTWTATGGQVDSAGGFVSVAPGEYTVSARRSGRWGKTRVTVTAPTTIGAALMPGDASLQVRDSLRFSAMALLSDGTTRSGSMRWSATGGTIDTAGTYRAGTTAGVYRVIAQDAGSGLADTAAVTVAAPPAATLTSLSLTPATVTVLPGTSTQFSVAAQWSDGSTVPPSVTYTAGGGTITSGGTYTARTTPGTFRVIATHSASGLADTSVVTIPAVPVSCAVTPGSVTLQAGQQQRFTAAVTMSDGSTGSPSLTWSATGGQVTSTGTYTAGNVAGTYRVLAAVVGTAVACQADVTIQATTAPTISSLQVSPSSATVVQGETQTFVALAVDANGNAVPATISWSATAGSISANGIYTAPATPQVALVVASEAASGVADTVSVTIVSPSTGGGSALWPNEPPGFSLVQTGTAGWESLPNGSWVQGTYDGWYYPGPDNTRTVVTATVTDSPTGEAKVLRHVYPANHVGGFGAEPRVDIGGKLSRVYLGFYARVSPNFFGHAPSGVTKLAYIRTSAPSSAFSAMWVEVRGFGMDPLSPSLVNQLAGTSGPGYGSGSAGQGAFARGQWHLVEVILEMEPVGRVRYFLDGRLMVDRTGIGGPSSANYRIDQIRLSGMLGGIGASNNPEVQFLEYDRVRVSGY